LRAEEVGRAQGGNAIGMHSLTNDVPITPMVLDCSRHFLLWEVETMERESATHQHSTKRRQQNTRLDSLGPSVPSQKQPENRIILHE
jgi:hypothetical protein